MDVERSRKLYRLNAPIYDLEALAFERIRTAAVRTLDARPGQTVLDLGCGTGLSFGPLERCVGEVGCIIGLDQSPEMLMRAERRVSQAGWRNVRLIEANATDASSRNRWTLYSAVSRTTWPHRGKRCKWP